MLKLAKRSDVVIENFSPRVMANWGLNYEVLKEAKPDIVMVSMSGMGQTGPWRDFVALGPTIQALCGITYLTSYSKELPVGMGYSYADVVAGLFAVVAVLGALLYKARSGRGQYVDISEYETMCSLLGVTLLDYAANCHLAVPQGNISEGLPASPYGCYRCRGHDKWCVIAAFTDNEWEAMCQAMGNPPWAEQDRFSTLSRRLEHQEELNDLVEQWTSNHTPEEVMDMLQGAGVAAGKVSNAADLANDPQLKSRDFFVQLHHPVLGKTVSDGTPIGLGRTPAEYKRAAPLLGQDNRYVYRDLLQLSEEQFDQYVAQGIIA
jgi:crotonobetainyl-CoA:carnitine CoA-transferase CaiB-like acyl-CoA transferase